MYFYLAFSILFVNSINAIHWYNDQNCDWGDSWRHTDAYEYQGAFCVINKVGIIADLCLDQLNAKRLKYRRISQPLKWIDGFARRAHDNCNPLI